MNILHAIGFAGLAYVFVILMLGIIMGMSGERASKDDARNLEKIARVVAVSVFLIAL